MLASDLTFHISHTIKLRWQLFTRVSRHSPCHNRQSEGGLEKIRVLAEMMVIPILEPALGDFAGALAVSTIEPNDRRFRTTVYSLAVTHWACDRYVIKIVCRLVHLKAANDEAKANTQPEAAS